MSKSNRTGNRSSSPYNADGQIAKVHKVKSTGQPDETVEYIWDGDRLAASEYTDYKDDGTGNYIVDDVVPVRYLYDTDGEPMGFSVMDMFTFVYRKNIFGDITGIDYVDGMQLVDFVYDAYGVPSASSHAPTGNNQNLQVKFFVLALFAVTYNVLYYRGYTHAGGFEYLGSRFYSPILGRFLNADVYEDTQTGVVGTNMFAYCNNNPVSFIDPDGNIAIVTAATLLGVPVVYLYAMAGLLILLVVIMSNGQVRLSMSQAIGAIVDYIGSLSKEAVQELAVAISGWVIASELGKIAGKYGNFQCLEAAKEMAKYLIKKGVEASVIYLYVQNAQPNYTNIYSDSKNAVISTNGRHFGVLFQGKAYCNVHPKGLILSAWLQDFQCATGSLVHRLYPLNWIINQK